MRYFAACHKKWIIISGEICQCASVKGTKSQETDAIRTKVLPLKPNWETTKIKNSHHTKKTNYETTGQLFLKNLAAQLLKPN